MCLSFPFYLSFSASLSLFLTLHLSFPRSIPSFFSSYLSLLLTFSPSLHLFIFVSISLFPLSISLHVSSLSFSSSIYLILPPPLPLSLPQSPFSQLPPQDPRLEFLPQLATFPLAASSRANTDLQPKCSFPFLDHPFGDIQFLPVTQSVDSEPEMSLPLLSHCIETLNSHHWGR